MTEIKKTLEVELNRMVERMRHMGGRATSVETIGTIGNTIQLADEVDVSQVNEGREMALATWSLLAERTNRLAEALERLRDGTLRHVPGVRRGHCARPPQGCAGGDRPASAARTAWSECPLT